MKAFLSHSSKDKALVRAVADRLGVARCEYDEYTFEFTLNAEAIRNALKRSTLFVFFLSHDSVRSGFVAEELRIALESRAAGTLRRVLVFSLDATSHKALPEWMREINVSFHITNAKSIARKIEASLIALEAETHSRLDVYIRRDDDEKDLRRALRLAPGKAPVALHAVGHYGIGRRTFLQKTLTELYPRAITGFIEIPLYRYEGAEEFYRRLYEQHVVASLECAIRDFEEFGKANSDEQVDRIVDLMVDLSRLGDFIIVDDQGGAYDEEGRYKPFLLDILNKLVGSARPEIGFIQTRMMPPIYRAAAPNSYHRFVTRLSDEQIKELLSFTLKDAEVDFSDEQLNAITQLLDGHPFNVKFVVQAIKSYGIELFISDPRDLIEWKVRRAEDFLKLINFSETETDLIAALSEYRYFPLELLQTILKRDIGDISFDLRRLEDHCCIERRDRYYQVASPIREAVRRDERFGKSDLWKKELANTITSTIGEYRNDEQIPIYLLEGANTAILRGASAPSFVSNLILPSHILTIARDCYDRRKWADCLDFCSQALAMSNRLTTDGQVEALRLSGLSTIRLGRDLTPIIQALKAYDSRTAQRNCLFLEGFDFRSRRRLDEAESKFLKAYALSSGNVHINRELAALYCKQRRYNEAEGYARAAYKQFPTNIYLIDIMAESLLGKRQLGLPVDETELVDVMQSLERYGDAPGSSFYLIRVAQSQLSNRKYFDALRTVNRAIERTENHPPAYFLRTEIFLALNDIPGAERDLATIDQLLTSEGGFSADDEARKGELDIRVLIEKRQFSQAYAEIKRKAFVLPVHVSDRLSSSLAKAITFSGEPLTKELREWANNMQKGGRP
jgi:tetratricopeptide (TPR) repeat protein